MFDMTVPTHEILLFGPYILLQPPPILLDPETAAPQPSFCCWASVGGSASSWVKAKSCVLRCCWAWKIPPELIPENAWFTVE